MKYWHALQKWMVFLLIILHKINFIKIYCTFKNPSHALFVTISWYFLGYVYYFTNNHLSKHIWFQGSWNLIFDRNSKKLVFIRSFECYLSSYYFKFWIKKLSALLRGLKYQKVKNKWMLFCLLFCYQHTTLDMDTLLD